MVIELMFYLVFVIISSIVAHELGHILAFKILKKDVKVQLYYNSWRDFGFNCGKKIDYMLLTDKQYIFINFLGIYLGLVIIIIAGCFEILALLLAVPYIWGCFHDIQNILKIGKDDE